MPIVYLAGFPEAAECRFSCAEPLVALLPGKPPALFNHE